MGARFIARFHGECGECDGAIFEGDEAGYMEGEVWCANCLNEAFGDEEVTLDDL